MERGHPHAFRLRSDELADALLHLRCGLISKGDGKDLPRRHPTVLQQIGNAAGQHRSFAGTSAGDDKQRATFVHDGRLLLRVQAKGHISHGSHCTNAADTTLTVCSNWHNLLP